MAGGFSAYFPFFLKTTVYMGNAYVCVVGKFMFVLEFVEVGGSGAELVRVRRVCRCQCRARTRRGEERGRSCYWSILLLLLLLR